MSKETSLNPEILTASNKYELMYPYDFLSDFLQKAKNASNRVYVQAMYFEDDHVFGPIANTLKQLPDRSLDTKLTVDYFTFMMLEGKITSIPALSASERAYRSHKLSRAYQTIDELRDRGVDVTITNPPQKLGKIIPTIGRNHKKIVVVDKTAWIGGLNYSQKDFNRPDFMLKVEEPSIVEALASEFEHVNDKRNPIDYEVQCTDDTSLLVDVGNKDESLILNSAIDIVSKAQRKINMVTQFNPDGNFLAALYNAYTRGVEINVIVSDPSYIKERLAWIFDRNNYLQMYRKGMSIPLIHYPGWVHTKLLIADSNGGNDEVLFGSHNLSHKGVKMGTEEIAMHSTNTEIINILQSYFDTLNIQSQN